MFCFPVYCIQISSFICSFFNVRMDALNVDMGFPATLRYNYSIFRQFAAKINAAYFLGELSFYSFVQQQTYFMGASFKYCLFCLYDLLCPHPSMHFLAGQGTSNAISSHLFCVACQNSFIWGVARRVSTTGPRGSSCSLTSW